jgi:asparagine synthase (glutamine-hydrolysing)
MEMCGIAGVLNLDGRPAAGAAEVGPLADALAHRGPDDAGLHVDGPVALGHRRLSILDLEGGHQPMLSADGRRAIVYNGEVYNFRELREELEGRGRVFRTRSDTEVVLAAYEEFGTEFAQRLNGMFAIALWDGDAQRLLLVRDRLGVKPLYYSATDRRLAFASEIKALLRLPGVDRAWDRQALFEFFQFLYVPCPRTAYAGIRQLPPGCMLSAERDGIRLSRYWDLTPALAGSPQSAGSDLVELLQDGVARRMIADVPVGCFLSGGIDSGLVVAFMSGATQDPVRSFTVFDPQEPYYDERERARRVAERYGTRHQELVAAGEVAELLDLAGSVFDEPFADSSALPNLLISRECRREVTVVLSGLGGDEIGGGYVRYLGMSANQRLGRAPRSLRTAMTALADLLPEGRGLALDRAKRFARLVGLPESEAYLGMVTAGTRLPGPVTSEALRRSVDASAPLERIASCLGRARELGCDRVNRLLYTDLLTYIPDDLLTLSDRTSMRFGLELREPFLDYRVVQHALAMPGSDKLRGRELKAGLRAIARDWLPPEVVDGPKRGFSVPMAQWLRGPLAQEMSAVVDKTGPETGLLDPVALGSAWREHRAGRANHETILWAALVFSRWAEANRQG